jgi:bifunctional DNA-binding transcriptional regulator/antitoxin component of YhaV-PrlF toxin-antitoxin module
MTVGYSGTPLAKKLGIKEGSSVMLIEEPEGYRSLLDPLPPLVSFSTQASQAIDLAHLFVVRKEGLHKQLATLRRTLRVDASVWVSWPKKSSKVPTNITEDTIREVALPLGFVDIKVCAVSEIWSGLKIVVRKELR